MSLVLGLASVLLSLLSLVAAGLYLTGREGPAIASGVVLGVLQLAAIVVARLFGRIGIMWTVAMVLGLLITGTLAAGVAVGSVLSAWVAIVVMAFLWWRQSREKNALGTYTQKWLHDEQIALKHETKIGPESLFAAVMMVSVHAADNRPTLATDAVLFEFGCYHLAELEVYGRTNHGTRAAPVWDALQSRFVGLMGEALGRDVTDLVATRVKSHADYICSGGDPRRGLDHLASIVRNATESETRRGVVAGEELFGDLQLFMAIQSWSVSFSGVSFDLLDKYMQQESVS